VSVTIYHNPRCSKSRQTLALLEERGLTIKVIEYLKEPPTEAELDSILTKLGTEPRDVMRKKEPPYKDNNLQDETLSRGQLIAAIAADPILLERPIVVSGAKAAIGRPPESVLEII